MYCTLVLFFYICPAPQCWTVQLPYLVKPTTSNMGSQCVSISGAVRMGIYQASSCNANAMEPGFLGGRMHRKRAFAQFLGAKKKKNGQKLVEN